MDADWGVEAGAGDPVVVVPWLAESAPGSKAQVPAFIDLRNRAGKDPAAVDLLPEVVEHPALRDALLRLNDGAGCLRTAKCDVWEIDPAEMESLRARFDLAPGQCGRGSYIDVLLAERFAEADLTAHEGWVRRMVRAAGEFDEVEGREESGGCAEFIVRPAQVDGAWGYAVTMYVWSVGDDAQVAEARWGTALRRVVSAALQAAPQRDHDTMCATGE